MFLCCILIDLELGSLSSSRTGCQCMSHSMYDMTKRKKKGILICKFTSITLCRSHSLSSPPPPPPIFLPLFLLLLTHKTHASITLSPFPPLPPHTWCTCVIQSSILRKLTKSVSHHLPLLRSHTCEWHPSVSGQQQGRQLACPSACHYQRCPLPR